MSFPKDFAWGVATAAPQIEGAANKGGRGSSIWDEFCKRSGKIKDGSTPEDACDHYHRYPEDVALMKQMGVKNYRLSISWSRVIASGVGEVNEAGLAFYDQLIDELVRNGITPWVTLFHWDLPYDLYRRGGFLNREMVDWFANYTALIVDRLSDRVSHWMTINEPQCFIALGMEAGIHAPGDQLGRSNILQAAHHVLLCHGRAVQIIRERSKKENPIIGWAPVVVSNYPSTTSEADIEAARKAMFSHEACRKINNFLSMSVWNNTWWADPIVFGKYPEDSWKAFGKAVPYIEKGDMELIAQPLDFFGANIYHGKEVRSGAYGKPEGVPLSTGSARTAFEWSVTPEALGWGVRFIHDRYKIPVVVTENGMACHDWHSLDGEVHDPQRIDFLHRYLLSLAESIKQGSDVRGYFVWSLLDNFEWAEGYTKRFGLIYVDYLTQQRTLKDSSIWYQQVIKSNGEVLFK